MSENVRTYSGEYLLRFSECDRHGRMKLKTLFDYAQESAGAHADALGVGAKALREKRQAWFLSRMRVSFAEYPLIGERVEVLTYPSGFERLFARREFQFSTKRLGVFAKATSNWLLMDTAAMRILPAPSLLMDIMPDNSDLPVAFPALGKLSIAPEDAAYRVHQVTGTQIDVNGHLNNTEYASILQDTLGIGVYPREFQLNYQKSVPPEGIVRIYGQRDANGEFVFTGRVEGNVAFEAAGNILNIEEGDTVYGI